MRATQLKKKKTRIIISFAIFIISQGSFNSAYAQKDSTEKKYFGGFLLLPIEFPVIDTRDIDLSLNNNGFPYAGYPKANMGIGFQIFSKRSIIHFSFNKSTKKRNYSTYVTEVEYRSTTFNFGYSLTKSEWYSIYPFIGFKGCGLNYLYREQIDSAITFSSYFQRNLKYKEVTNSRAHLDLGLGLSSQWLLLINFRFGYLFPIEAIRWNINNNATSLKEAPSANYNYYFTLNIGFGGIISDSKRQRGKLLK